jgi:hypothetical protein
MKQPRPDGSALLHPLRGRSRQQFQDSAINRLGARGRGDSAGKSTFGLRPAPAFERGRVQTSGPVFGYGLSHGNPTNCWQRLAPRSDIYPIDERIHRGPELVVLQD